MISQDVSPDEPPAPDTPARGAIASAMAAAFVLTFALRWVTASFPNDHFTHLSRARQIVLGEWPIRDFFDPGQFLHYYLSTAAQVVFGYSMFGEALLTVGFLALSAAITCGMASRLSGSIAIGAGATALSVMSSPRLYNYPKVFIYPTALWLAWRYAQRPTRGRLAWLAVFSIVAFLFRYDHGAYVVATMAALLVLVHLDRPRQWLAATATYGVLCALLLAPFALYVQWADGLRRYVREERSAAHMVGDEMASASPVRLAVSQPAPNDAASQGGPAATPRTEDAAAERPRRPQNPTTPIATALWQRLGTIVPRVHQPIPAASAPQIALWWFYYVVVFLPYATIALCAGGWWRGRIDRREAATVAAAAFMCFVIVRTLVRNNPSARLADVAAPMAVLGAWVAGRWLTVPPTGALRAGGPAFRRLVFGLFSVITFWSVAVQAQLVPAFRSAHLLDGPQAIRAEFADVTRDLHLRPIDYWAPPDQRTGLRALVRYVRRCTQPTDRLVATGAFAPEAAFYAERAFGGGQVHFLGGWHDSLEDQGLTIERLKAQSIPIVLALETDTMDRNFPHVQHYFEHYYHEVPLPPVAADTKPWHLLVETRRTPVGTDPVLGLPCYRDPPGDE